VASTQRRSVATDAVGTIRDVPTIGRFFGITITMYFDDHGPPHFMLATPTARPRSASTRSKSSTVRPTAGTSASSSRRLSSTRMSSPMRIGGEHAPVRH